MRRDEDFRDFYEANYGHVLAMVTAMLGDRAEAEDVTQEAFARSYSRWSLVGGFDKPEAWVRRVALRLAIDSARRLRRVGRVTAKLAAQSVSDRLGASLESPGRLADDSLLQALGQLPLHEREVIVLHYLADLPVDVIARERGLAEGTVKTRLAAGRRRLTAALSQSPEEASDAR